MVCEAVAVLPQSSVAVQVLKIVPSSKQGWFPRLKLKPWNFNNPLAVWFFLAYNCHWPSIGPVKSSKQVTYSATPGTGSIGVAPWGVNLPTPGGIGSSLFHCGFPVSHL